MEHCSYFGAYCNSGDPKQKSESSDVSRDHQETNGSRLYEGWAHSGFSSDSSHTRVLGLIKVSVELILF